MFYLMILVDWKYKIKKQNSKPSRIKFSNEWKGEASCGQAVQWRGIIKSYVTIISTINKRGIVVNVKPSNYRVSISKLFNCIPELNKTTRKKQIHTKDQIIFGIKFYILGYHKNLVFGMDFNMLWLIDIDFTDRSAT